jgi:hypothetical protein
VEVVAGIGRAAQAQLLREVPKDQHRRFPGDALGRPEDVLVGHDVSDHEDAPTLELPDDPKELGSLRTRHGGVGGTARLIGSWRRGLLTGNPSPSLY